MALGISESGWKAFVKKQKLAVELDDKELLKALARFDKSDERKPELRLEALKELTKEVPRQVTALLKLKKQLGDKPFGLVKDELYAILEEAEALQKKAQAAVDAAGEEDEEDDEESAPSALVNPKLLLKQLSMCRKDPERTMKFAFVDAKGKDQPAMLAMHPRLSARKLFSKLQVAAGVKTGAYGSAWVDGMSLMLQLDKPLSGLVKKVRGPVKACGFRFTKAVLWDADGTVFEQDSEDGEAATSGPGVPGNGAGAGTAPASRAEGANGAGSAVTGAPNAGSNGAGAATDTAVPKRSPQETKALSDAFKERLKAVLALSREAGDTPVARQAKQLCVDAGMHAGKRDWARVDELMIRAEGLFSVGKATTGASTEAASSASGAGAGGDLAKSWASKVAAWTPAIKAAMTAKGPTASAMAKLYVQATSLSKPGGDLAQALAKLTECHDLALAAAAPPAGSTSAGAGPTAPATGQQAPADRKSVVSRWEAQQSLLAAKLNGELAWIKKVAADRDPKNASLGDELLKAELEMTAVMRRVRAPVRTPEQAAEMEHFLKDDDVVSALCDYTGFDVRPVVAALQQFKSLAA
jgi:hypothetical protein